MTNTAAQQRRRRARKKRGITLRTNRPKLKLKPLSGWHYGKRKA